MDDVADLPGGQDPPISDDPPRPRATTGGTDVSPQGAIDACHELVQLADSIVASSPDLTPQDFLTTLAERAAGIHPGMLGMFDLARGGANRLPGRGFRPAYDDGSLGQVRHFVGIALAASLLGAQVTIWLAEHFLRDDPDSADGRLSEVAVEFATALTEERLPVADAATWMGDRLCIPISP